jgi:pimeloyl-ACP methyl ester carboxylesterase
MQKIYCISGMGCDHRVFKRLQVPGYQLVAVPWVPYDEQDTLVSYAAKMAKGISDEGEIILLGLSFGGMLATEICKIRPVKQLILISSAKTYKELPEPGALGRYIVAHKLIPSFCFAIPNRLLMAMRGIVPLTEKLSANSFTAINGRFMQWALKMVLEWHNTEVPANAAHIHGTMDVVIPGRNVQATHRIKNGIHLMVFSRAAEVSRMIAKVLGE